MQNEGEFLQNIQTLIFSGCLVIDFDFSPEIAALELPSA